MRLETVARNLDLFRRQLHRAFSRFYRRARAYQYRTYN